MVFILCSVTPEREMASISFSGSNLSEFGFKAGSRVLVDISKGKIVIKTIDEISNKDSSNKCFERR